MKNNNKNSGFFTVCLLLITALLGKDLTAGDSVKDIRDFKIKQKKFIFQLFSRKRYFDCIGETKRLLSFAKNIDQSEEYRFFILGNYFSGRQYKTVIFNLKKNSPAPDSFRERILLSQSYLRLGKYGESYSVLKEINYNHIPKDKRYNLFVRKIEPLINGGFYNMALDEFQNAKLYIPSGRYLQLQKSFNKFKKSGFKLPGLSVALSLILPGAGQIYSGKYPDAILTFAGIAAAAGGSYYFFRRGGRGLGYSFAFFSILFYGGNIYSAYNAANYYNNRFHREFVKGMYRSYIPVYRPENEIDLEGLFN